MKNTLFAIACLIISLAYSGLNAQTTCMDFTGTTPQYLQDISVNNTLYPIGSVVFQNSPIRIRKAGTPAQFLSASGDTLCYIGLIDIDVALASFAQRQLSFVSIALGGMVVDGDTIFQNNNAPALYNGNGFSVAYLNNVFTISGAFDTVHLFGSTNCISAVCLSPGTQPSQSCLWVGSVTQQYISDINYNHTLYPVGTLLFQTGDIKIRKVDTTTIFLSASSDTICYIGRLEIDIAAATYTNRRLTFVSIAAQGIIVDGDTAFQNYTPPAIYNGPNYNLTYSNNVFVIRGTFNTVRMFGSTNCISNVCLTSDTISTQTCADFTGTTPQYIQDISVNNTLYPVGSIIFQTGDIRFRKVAVPTQFISASGDTLCYIGKIEIDISTASYPQRQLSFYSIITQGMIVDGDTIFQNSNPPALYNGTGFTVAYANNIFTITGAFDTVHIFGSTNCLSTVCLSSIPTEINQEIEGMPDFSIFPNPANKEFAFLNHSSESGQLTIYSLQGDLVYSVNVQSPKTNISVENLNAGVYFIRYNSLSGTVQTKRLIIGR